jgi:riboflavin biosynthesis pyrimidine reductase
MTLKCTISKDGKTATCSGKAKDAKGQDAAADIIYEKQ